MQVCSAVFYTLATLVAGNVQERAIAVSRSQTTTPAEKASNLVVPVTEGIPARIKTIAPPDTVVIPQFSPNYANVQTSSEEGSYAEGSYVAMQCGLQTHTACASHQIGDARWGA